MKEFSKLSMELIEPSNNSLLIWTEHSSEFFCLSVRLSFHLPVCLSVKFWHFHLVFQKHWANFSLTQSILGRRGFKRLQIKIEAFSQAEIMAYFNTRPFILLINVSQISNGALRSLFSFVKQLKKKSFEFCVCVCLFGVFSSQSRIFHPFGDNTINGEGLQILTYARHSWPVSSEGSLVCQTYCDTGHPFIMLTSEDTWHSHLMPDVWQWMCHYCINNLGLSRLEFEHPTFRLRGEQSNTLRHHFKKYFFYSLYM